MTMWPNICSRGTKWKDSYLWHILFCPVCCQSLCQVCCCLRTCEHKCKH